MPPIIILTDGCYLGATQHAFHLLRVAATSFLRGSLPSPPQPGTVDEVDYTVDSKGRRVTWGQRPAFHSLSLHGAVQVVVM